MRLDLGDTQVNWREDGNPSGRPVVFANSLGTNLHLWDQIIPLLPQNLRLIRYDMRGHGETSVPDAPYKMGILIRDAERLLDALKIRDCIFVGLSIGGMIGQGLATKRLDQIRALVLSNTAAKMGTPQIWQDRITTLRRDGMEGIADAVMERWFGTRFRNGPDAAHWKEMLLATPVEGYAGCAAAIAGTDFFTQTAGLKLPCLAIAGSDDKASPPDLVRETAALVQGSQFHLIRGAGHLPCVEKPEEFARVLDDFLAAQGHT